MGWGYDDYREYVPVAQKKSQGLKHATALAKRQGRQVSPVIIEGRKIARTFWGTAWCDNLQAYSDYANRLPRGATYVRNGSVVDLVIKPGKIEAIVAGSDPYTVTITISELNSKAWQAIKRDCTTEIDSLLDLLAGKFSDGVMQRLTRQGEGLFPHPQEIKMHCSCPDGSYCCKHLAAVMYGVGSRLDTVPELLFTLRRVDPQELVSQAVSSGNLNQELSAAPDTLAGQDLEALFGIELDVTPQSTPRTARGKLKTSPNTAAAKPPVKTPKTPTAARQRVVKKPAIAIAKSVAVAKSAGVKSVAAEPVASITSVKKTSKKKRTTTAKLPDKKPAKTKVAVKRKAARKSVEKAVVLSPSTKRKPRLPR